MRVLLTIIGLSILASTAAAQSTITNADLEKYRQKRLAAERELREDYERLGFPSPEELEAKRIADAKEREELAARLASERIAREQAEAQLRANDLDGVVIVNEQNAGGGSTIYGYAYPTRYRPYWRGGRLIRRGPIIGWRAGPGGVIYEPGGRSSYTWSPSTTRTRPVFRVPR